MAEVDGAPDSFVAWYQANAARLTAVLYGVSGDAELATDCVAEAAARALARWGRVSTLPDPSAWVYRVALNELRRRARRQHREHAVVAAAGTERVELPERDLDLWHAVAVLPERMRMAVALRYLADLSEMQVAELLGISRGGVSALLTKARHRLAAQIPAPLTEEHDHG